MIINEKTIAEVNALFNLPNIDYDQDWPIEVADKSRVKEFINYASRINIPFPIRYALVSLILASYDDLLDSNENETNIWKDIETILDNNKHKYDDLLKYWALQGKWETNTEDDLFNITPYIRKYSLKP